MDIMLAGANFQIEHHLFPTMPTCSLRSARVIVKEYCIAHGIPYAETTLAASYGRGFRYLHAIGLGARRT
jgi:fatty acid desaturase